MSQESKLASIIKRFKDNYSLTPIAHKNRQFDVDVGSDWVRLNVVFGDELQKSMGDVGGRTFRQVGVIFVEIYVRPGKGTGRTAEIVDTVKLVWRGAQFDGITCLAPDTSDLGQVDNWYQVNVGCEFYYDETY